MGNRGLLLRFNKKTSTQPVSILIPNIKFQIPKTKNHTTTNS
jgi:hypothetical protein